MEPTIFFHTIWPTMSVIFVMPMTQWLKSKIPGDWPISSQLLSIVLNALVIYVAKEISGMEIPIEQLWPYVTGGVVASSTVHSLAKTKKKNFN